jgi:hypothetical protein
MPYIRKRLIFIAKNHNNDTIGIVLAEAREIAHAYFVGRGQIPHSMDEIDPDNQELGVLGLVILLKTREVDREEVGRSYHRPHLPALIVQEK